MKHRKISDELKTDVRKHIESIPRIESHYLRAQTTREYIAGGYSLSSLWRTTDMIVLLLVVHMLIL